MRKLASIQKISSILPIDGADSIEVATIGGWNVVVKKHLHTVGEQVVYFEIDSWIPENIAPFLANYGSPAKEFEGVVGFRLKSKKLRGVVSQGLIISINDLSEINVETPDDGVLPFNEIEWLTGEDVTDVLGVVKYEKPISASLGGDARGNFPYYIPKTDQERIQNLSRQLGTWSDFELEFEVTEKLDGTSVTIYKNSVNIANGEPEYGVCSRNIDFTDTPNNVYWLAAKNQNVHDALANDGRNLAVQGEIIGVGIQGNQYKLSKPTLYVFDIYDIDNQRYLKPDERREFCKEHDLNHVPLVAAAYSIAGHDIPSLLNMADGKSQINDSKREGLVFKCVSHPGISFKAVSNKWLLKYEE